LHCKRRLNSGEYGYWSKGSKSILHETCYDSLFFPYSVKKESSSNTTEAVTLDKTGNKTVSPKNKDGAIGSSNGNSNNNNYGNSVLGRKRAKNTKCFTCSNNVDFDNELIISLLKLAEGYNCNSDVLYCHDCLENPSNGVYENYKKKFMNAL
jgi:hypothetical protein